MTTWLRIMAFAWFAVVTLLCLWAPKAAIREMLLNIGGSFCVVVTIFAVCVLVLPDSAFDSKRSERDPDA